ncbi:MAG: HAMP domain-containing protein [Bacteroidetes bacterium]|nr:MAG: HAMP domain-containing protein [Bacteroidota bacterium]
MWFETLKLRTKLILSFGLVVFILLAVNIYSNLRLFSLQKSNSEIAEVHLPSLVTLAELKLLLADFRATQLAHGNTTDKLRMKFEEGTMQKLIEDIALKQDIYKQFLDKEAAEKRADLQKLFTNYERSWEEYRLKHQRFLTYSRQNDNAKALEYLQTEAKDFFDLMNLRLSQLMDLNKDLFFSQVKGIEAIYGRNVMLNLLLLIIPLIATVLIVFYLVRIILKPIRTLEKAVRQVSEGDLDITIQERDTDDEVGRLAKNFKQMAQNIKEVKQHLEKREWTRHARTELNQIINESIDAQLGMQDFSQEIVTFLAHYTEARLGAIYLLNEEKTELYLSAGFALSEPKQSIPVGEGLLGEFAKDVMHKCTQKRHKAKPQFLQNLPPHFLKISSATGESSAENLIQIPFQFENELIGAVELGGWQIDSHLSEKLELAELLSFSLGIGFHSQLNALKVRKLLQETQLQAHQLEEQATILEEKNQDISQQKEEIEAQRDALDSERKRTDELLLNILPAQVAQELKETGGATPQYYKRATVLFTDFKGFTAFASKLSPTEIVEELDYCFLAFDEIIGKYGLEKIKTIGDSYMCAGGLPTPNETNPIDTVLAALEIRDFMEAWHAKRIAEGKEAWHIRVGIHTGELVAGVVGKKKFAYDIWGDAVNIASRMESNSEADKINISATTYEAVKHLFDCTFRGKLPVKNAGEVAMYFVEGKKV